MYFSFGSLLQAEISFFKEMQAIVQCLPDSNKSICVAVSGGSDSLALLILAKKWCVAKNWKLCCCTVDHKLRKESLDEALYVQSVCKQLDIDHYILSWQHDTLLDHGKLETLAREARYDLLRNFCKENFISFIATGHNWNDQIETYEIRKQAGSHSHGLACMSQIKSLDNDLKIIRPLLHFSKKYLEDFLINMNIPWKTDPMNFQDNFKRVVARQRINSYSFDKIQEVSQEIRIYGDIRRKIEEATVKFIQMYCYISYLGYAEINKSLFLEQKEEVQIETLRRLIWNIGMKQYPCSITKETLNNILKLKINTLGRCFIKIKKDKIYVFREKRNIKKSTEKIWDNRFIINLELTKNQYIYSADRDFNQALSFDILAGFPCLYEDDEVKYEFGEWTKFVKFIVRADLLDIYCGVNCE